MDDKTYSRENKKRKLKQNIVSFVPQEEQELSEELEDLKRRKIRRVMVRVIVASAILLGIFFAWRYYGAYHVYETYEEVWSQDMPEGASSGYIAFGENVLKFTRDGASYISSSGSTLWSQSYDMRHPVAAVCGSYAAVADQKGNRIMICDKEGNASSLIMKQPILKIAVAAQGVVAVILEDSISNHINLYSYDGTELVTMKASLSGNNGYPLDVSISPDGTQFMVSYVNVSNGVMQNHVVFYNFSEKGQNVRDHLVGGFMSEGSAIVPKVQFLTNERACTFSDSNLVFYSLKNELSPEQVSIQEVTGEIQNIFYNSNYVGIIAAKAEEGARYELQVFSSSGAKVFQTDLDLEYSKAEFGEDAVMLWNTTDCVIFNMKGVVKFSGVFDFEIVQMIKGQKAGNFIIISPARMSQIKLK